MAKLAFLRPNQSSTIRPCRNPNPNSNRSRHQKRSPADSLDRPWLKGGTTTTTVVKLPSKDLVMGQVKILKRGEKMESKEEELVSSSPSHDRLVPETTKTTQNWIKVYELDKIYAGSVGVLSSPPPSSLPLPTFLSKKRKSFNRLDLL